MLTMGLSVPADVVCSSLALDQGKKMKCILCCEEKPVTKFSDEHVFPDAIGGKLILKNTVCTDCNSQYGHGVDSDLVNHELIKLARLAYQIKGKSGKVPNPLENGDVVGKESHKVKFKIADDGNSESLYIIPKIEKQTIDNGLLISGHIDASDADKLKEIIRSICKRQGMVVSEEELKKIRNPEVIRSRPEIRVQMTFDLIKYKKGILKIAYELAYYWLGEKYIGDPVATKIREVLKDQRSMSQWEGVYDLKGKIDFIVERSKIPFWDDKPASHIAFLIQSHGVLTIYVRIFKAFEGFIEISKKPELYKIEDGPFIRIDTESDKMEQSTILQQLALLGKHMI